jgi:aryl-alcohol dehydrogenase-like predicted oxidoreductase
MAKIPTRQLGKNGPQVSALGFGAMGLSAFYGTPASDEERFKVLDRAIELGSTYFDSADIYGDNEELLGKYFKKYPEQRKKVFLATKFANVISAEGKFSVRGDAQYVREASDKSFKRLGLDSIDLYYAHRIDKTVPIEETVGAMKELVDAGKVKYIGLSECSSDTLRRAHAVHPIACVQIEYSPFSLDIEREEIGLLKTCRELGVAIVCYSPLGRGMLTGQYKSPDDFEENDFRRHAPRFSKENFPKNLVLVDQLAAIAKKKGCTPGQLTLAWILAQGEDFIAIPGTSKIKNLEENAAATQIKLSKEEVQEIRQACENADVAGERYGPQFSAHSFSDSAPKKK